MKIGPVVVPDPSDDWLHGLVCLWASMDDLPSEDELLRAAHDEFAARGVEMMCGRNDQGEGVYSLFAGREGAAISMLVGPGTFFGADGLAESAEPGDPLAGFLLGQSGWVAVDVMPGSDESEMLPVVGRVCDSLCGLFARAVVRIPTGCGALVDDELRVCLRDAHWPDAFEIEGVS